MAGLMDLIGALPGMFGGPDLGSGAVQSVINPTMGPLIQRMLGGNPASGALSGGIPIPARNVSAINPAPTMLPAMQTAPTAAMLAAYHPQGGLQRVLGAIGEAFGGPRDPGLSDEQNAAARRQALLQAGLGMMAASGPSTQPRSLGQIVAQGAMLGQQAGGAARQEELARSQREAMRQTVARIAAQGMGPEQLKAIFAQAVMNNDPRTANSAAMILQAQLAADSKGKQGAIQIGKNTRAVMGPDGRLMWVAPEGGEPTFDPRRFKVVGNAVVDLTSGRPIYQGSATAKAPAAPKTPATVLNAKAEADASAAVAKLAPGAPDMVLRYYEANRQNWDEHDARVYRALVKLVKAQQTGSGNPAAAAAAAAAKGGQ